MEYWILFGLWLAAFVVVPMRHDFADALSPENELERPLEFIARVIRAPAIAFAVLMVALPFGITAWVAAVPFVFFLALAQLEMLLYVILVCLRFATGRRPVIGSHLR